MDAPPRLFMDIECYKNYFLVMFMAEDGRVAPFDMYDGKPLDVDGISRVLSKGDYEFHTFNGNTYDMCMLSYALAGATCEQLKAASDDIIVNDLKPWEFRKKYECVQMTVNHVDLIEVAPGMVSLKIYGGRLGTKTLQELPIEPDAEISPEQRKTLMLYCRNDLRNTKAVSDELAKQIALRRTMSDELGYDEHGNPVDLRSKSDAQIAEAVLKHRVKQATGLTPRKWPIAYDSFHYEPPPHIQFYTQELKDALNLIASAKLVVQETGHVKMPSEISKLTIKIGKTRYKLGIGGLHSQESEVTHYADDEVLLRDIDVRSYYPNLMLNMGMYPQSMGPHFLEAYKAILVERLEAKDAGEKVKDAALKITLNGTFGKTSSKYSVLYNPKMMIATTLTGQLSILMLIEALERRGIPIVSANTDGIVTKCPRAKEPLLRRVVKVWEQVTNLETEETDYKSIHSRDVNSYVAIKLDGGVKTKGFFAIPKYGASRLAKSPQNEICTEAVIEFLVNGTPVEETVRACRDISKFLTLRTVSGGAIQDDESVGKAIRWYYAEGVEGAIHYAKNDNRVPRSEGSKLLMVLPDEFPDDVNYDWYVTECNEMLMDIGVVVRPLPAKLPRKNSKAWLALLERGRITEAGEPVSV